MNRGRFQLPTRALLCLQLVALLLPGSFTAARSAPLDDHLLIGGDSSRAWLESPFLRLEINLRQPAIDVIRVAPLGDRKYGPSLGSIVEEGAQGTRRLRSTNDFDGAQVAWGATGSDTQLRIEGIDVEGAARVTWTLTVAPDRPSLRLQRQVLGQPGLDSSTLAVSLPATPEGTDPTALVRLLHEGVYRLEVGPPNLERPGSMLGSLSVDSQELSFSARTDSPDRVSARQEGKDVLLGFTRRLPFRAGGSFNESIGFRFGWDNDYLPARSDGMPDIERRLLAAGYYGNAVITQNLGTVLSASMRDYRGSVWSRDSDYALQGYGYVLDDLSVFRNVLQRFLERVDRHGVAPEYILLNGEHGNRESWDSMANVIEAMRTYVARTGDIEFYRKHAEAVSKALSWIRALDTNNDGLPDRDIFPYGYTDTVENGPMHTYAIAKFYAAFLAAAELEEATGRSGRTFRAYAQTMRQSFARPLSAGGYWNSSTGYPIAWKRANGKVITTFETFGVFEAIRVGLLNEPAQLSSVAGWLDLNRDAFLNGNSYPERLMIGGYELATKKAEVPWEKLWIMDCNAPWITGISVPARVALGRLEDARDMLLVYASSSNRGIPHAEFGSGPQGAFGPGETQDGGRLWDNWSWFNAVYGTHFGLKMTIPALEVQPSPLDWRFGRRAQGIPYQGARVDLELLEGGYRFSLDQPRQVVLRPPYGFSQVEVNGAGPVRPSHALLAQPGVTYTVLGRR